MHIAISSCNLLECTQETYKPGMVSLGVGRLHRGSNKKPQIPKIAADSKSNLGSSGPSSGGGGGGADMTSINSWWHGGLHSQNLKDLDSALLINIVSKRCRLCMPPGHLVACCSASGCSRAMCAKKAVERVMYHKLQG